MIEKNINCHNCQAIRYCPKPLKPEWLRPMGPIVTTHIPIARDICRHTTCGNGMLQALLALSEEKSGDIQAARLFRLLKMKKMV